MKLITAEEVSQKFFGGRLSYYAVNSMARKKQIPFLKIGNRVFFDTETLEQYFKMQMQMEKSVAKKEAVTQKVKGIARIE